MEVHPTSARGDVPAPDIDGVVRSDEMTRQLYSTDASIYEIEPDFVLFPFNRSDVKAITRWSREHNVSLVPRGSGTSLSGQAIGRGAVVDYSRHFTDILDWNADRETVTVEPGVVLDRLNTYLNERGRHFGPDVATSNRATIGGMIGNNSAGAHSIRYGYTAQHVKSLTCILPNGEEVLFEEIPVEEARRAAQPSTLEGKLYDTVPELVRDHREIIRKQYPDLLRNVSGYGLDRFLDKLDDGTVDFTELICGAEGTLGTVVEAELKTVPAIREKCLVVVNCDSLEEAVQINRRVVEESPLAVELLDNTLLELASDSLEISRYMDWVSGDPEAVLIVEVGSEQDGDQLEERISTVDEAIKESNPDADTSIFRDPEDQQAVWKVRKSGLPLLLGISDDRKPTTFVEDTAVDPSYLSEYVSEFQDLVENYGTTAAFYGHISVGCLHIRPLINLKDSDGIEDMRSMTEDVVELVKKYHGALSGEHGDGRSRSEWLDEFYSPAMTELFRDLKTTFDPDHRLNPGNIVDPESMTEQLRFGADYSEEHWDLQQDFSDQGGFSEIIERCNGSAVCRKENSGTMCPSYMVTRDEMHSTRGRANALRGLISGELDDEALTDGRMEAVMELCISCKACKSECPSEVDMAPLKEEVSHRIHQENGANLRERFFGSFGRIARISSTFQPLVNWFQSVPAIESIAKWMLNLSPDRDLPEFASNPVSAGEYNGSVETADRPVVLYADTFSGYLEPDLFRTAHDILTELGLDPIVPEVPCCGRTYLSQGFLDRAGENARRTVESLYPFAEEGIPILTLEPSCYSAIVDDHPRLVAGEKPDRVADRTELLSDYLLREHARELSDDYDSVSSDVDVWIHGHCHQKALVGEKPIVQLMKTIARGRVEFIDSGCCGMAGSFGYEEEHSELSERMAERALLPAVRQVENGDRVVAPGLSCRQQIRQLSTVNPIHPVELIGDQVLAQTEV